MYLKRTSIGPLVDNELEAAANAAAKSAVKALKRMKQAGQLPGWSKADEASGKGMPFNFCYPDSGIFDLQKQGDSFIYHFEFAQEPKTGSWKLRKAWRTDESDHTVGKAIGCAGGHEPHAASP